MRAEFGRISTAPASGAHKRASTSAQCRRSMDLSLPKLNAFRRQFLVSASPIHQLLHLYNQLLTSNSRFSAVRLSYPETASYADRNGKTKTSKRTHFGRNPNRTKHKPIFPVETHQAPSCYNQCLSRYRIL